MDKSNGYEGIAPIFIKGRGVAANGIGSSTVRIWAKTLKPNSVLLDMGCGTGIPMSKILMEAGMYVYGIDASPSMVEAFRRNLPNLPVACEAVEDSFFFNRRFEVIFSWGLIFLLSHEVQEKLIKKAANALNPGGIFLFTSPPLPFQWKDAMTEQESFSLGRERYKQLLTESGLSLNQEFEDEGENHYYHSIKI
jgi:cyclopropane fatty-acyl-phospholipid synthase-like methyltransferase